MSKISFQSGPSDYVTIEGVDLVKGAEPVDVPKAEIDAALAGLPPEYEFEVSGKKAVGSAERTASEVGSGSFQEAVSRVEADSAAEDEKA